jgi:hypothetical protein
LTLVVLIWFIMVLMSLDSLIRSYLAVLLYSGMNCERGLPISVNIRCRDVTMITMKMMTIVYDRHIMYHGYFFLEEKNALLVLL